MYQCLMYTLKWFISLFAHLKFFKLIQNIPWLKTGYWQQSFIYQSPPPIFFWSVIYIVGSWDCFTVLLGLCLLYFIYWINLVLLSLDMCFLSCHSFKIYWHPCTCCATLYKIIITVVRYLKTVAVLSTHFRPGHILKKKTCFWSWNWINCFNAKCLAYFLVVLLTFKIQFSDFFQSLYHFVLKWAVIKSNSLKPFGLYDRFL